MIICTKFAASKNAQRRHVYASISKVAIVKCFLLFLGTSTSGIVITYKNTQRRQAFKPVGPCSWCKKVASLQDYTSSDGEKDVFCTGMCSALCFEQAIRNIQQSKEHIKHVQESLRGVPISGTRPESRNGE